MIEGVDLELFERSLRQAAERLSGRALDDALAELGWPDALEADPVTAVSALFPALGRSNAVSGALHLVLAAALGVDREQAPALLLPALGSWLPPGVISSGRLHVRGLGWAGLADRLADHPGILVAATDAGSGEARGPFRVPAAALTLRPIRGMDPAAGLVDVTGDTAAPNGGATAAWQEGMAQGQRALGLELVGSARAMLDLAREHALDRIQFGQPIAKFQAVRHRLAETLVAIESAEAVLAAAAETPSPELSAMAKALAGRGARTAARHCQQVLAGIGFTAEHPFHRHLRRSLVLDQMLGSSRALTEDLGRRLLETRGLPELLPL